MMVARVAKYYIACVKWVFFLDRVWSLQYESKASALGQKLHLALGAHHIYCNTCTLFRIFVI